MRAGRVVPDPRSPGEVEDLLAGGVEGGAHRREAQLAHVVAARGVVNDPPVEGTEAKHDVEAELAGGVRISLDPAHLDVGVVAGGEVGGGDAQVVGVLRVVAGQRAVAARKEHGLMAKGIGDAAGVGHAAALQLFEPGAERGGPGVGAAHGNSAVPAGGLGSTAGGRGEKGVGEPGPTGGAAPGAPLFVIAEPARIATGQQRPPRGAALPGVCGRRATGAVGREGAAVSKRGWRWAAVGLASLLVLLGAHLAWEHHRYRLRTPEGAIPTGMTPEEVEAVLGASTGGMIEGRGDEEQIRLVWFLRGSAKTNGAPDACRSRPGPRSL